MPFPNASCGEDRADPYPYASFVAAQTRPTPSLEQLSRFLSHDISMRYSCRIACLEFSVASGTPSHKSLTLNDLASLLHDESLGSNSLQGRILIVEDLTRDIIELLGSTLNVDPFFFASHIDVFQPSIATSRPYMATLPSVASTQDSLTLHYHRVLQFDSPTHKRTLLQATNVPRKVKILPSTQGVNVGLARHCCSVLKTVGKDGLWLCLVLVDPSTSIFYASERQDDTGAMPVSFQSQSFNGGFENFLPRPAFTGLVNSRSEPERRSLLEDLVFYWRNGQPQAQGFDSNTPTLVSLSQYPLRIVAAEWMVYLQVMYHSTKHYEFTPGTISAALEQISVLYADLSGLQKWARRNMATSYKLRYVIDFLRVNTIYDQDAGLKTLLLRDFNHIASTAELYSSRLNEMVPIVTSLIQIIDSRRSLIETANISRLTHLALVFVPLTFITGLFSMKDTMTPGGKSFWLYFAIAIPTCLIVYLLARPPVRCMALFARTTRKLPLVGARYTEAKI